MPLTPDQHQDVARSNYADMLNDDERNRAYYLAIRITVRALVISKEHNPMGDRFFQCLDIGTGSGLLSMMIVSAFQELQYNKFHVQAVEEFKPMAECARKVIDRNGLSNSITVHPVRLDKLEGQWSFDLLVAELLDTELIGEGCISAYKFAVENLCSPTCLFIPHKAIIYIEPVASKFLFQRHAISDLKCNVGNQRTVTIRVAEEVKNCCGLTNIYDIQASRLKEGQDFTRICKSQAAFTFTFNNLSTLLTCDYTLLNFPICYSKHYNKGFVEEPIVLVMWWDIEMYDKAFIFASHHDESEGLQPDQLELNLDVLSCAPVWARSEAMLQRDKLIESIYKRSVWREHWIQGVYYFQDVLGSRQLLGELCYKSDLIVHCHHDSHSLWFDLTYDFQETLPKNCSCGVHRSLSRNQLGFLNDEDQMTKLLGATVPLAPNKSYEGTIEFVPRQIAIEGAPKWSIQLKLEGARSKSAAGNCAIVEEKQNEPILFDLSLTDEVAWKSVMMRFFDEVSIDPILSFTIKCTQVQFESLNRIRTDIGICEGFNLKDLDDMISCSSLLIDQPIESHSLWEYESKRLDSDHEIFSTETLTPEERLSVQNGSYWRRMRFPVRCGYGDWKKGWALVFWAEFTLMRTGKVLSTGPMERSHIEDSIEWNRYCKQMVYFMHHHRTPPFSNVCVELEIGLSGSDLQIQQPVNHDALPVCRN